MCYQGSQSPTQYKRRKQTWQKGNYHQPKYATALVWHFFLLCSVFPFCIRQGFLFLLRFFHLVCSMLWPVFLSRLWQYTCGFRSVSFWLTHQFKTSTGNLLLCPYLYRLCPFSYTGITHKWHKKETPLSFQKGMFSSSFFSFSRYAPKRKYPLCTCLDFPWFWCTAIWLWIVAKAYLILS